MRTMSVVLVALLTAIGLVIGCVSANAQPVGTPQDKRVALVVGNAKYKAVSPLVNPANDAPDMAKVLGELGFEVILAQDADLKGFNRAVANFRRAAKSADVMLFFYAGHGVQSGGMNYLLPVDADIIDATSIEGEAVSVDVIKNAFLEANPSGIKIMVLDACRNNPFSDRLKSGNRAIGERGLAPILAPQGSIVAYATQANAVAQDGTERNSPYTAALLNRLREPGLKVSDLFQLVGQDVAAKTNQKQVPELSISSVRGDYYLNLAESDRMAWDRISQAASVDPGELKRFIETYPASRYVRQVQMLLDAMQLIADRAQQERARKADELAKRADEQARLVAKQEEDRLKALAAAEDARRRDEERQQREREQAVAIQRQREFEAEQKKQAEEAARMAEIARRQKELEEKQALAKAKADKERIEKELLAQRQAEEKRRAEEAKRLAEACARDEGTLKQLAAGGRRTAIDELRATSTCPTIGRAADEAVKTVEAAEARVCDAERRELASFKDLADLRRKTLAFKCLPLKGEADARIAALESEENRRAEICAGEAQKVAAFKGGGSAVRDDLASLRKALTCEGARKDADLAIRSIDLLVRTAQVELKRLSCYAGPASGSLDEATRAAVSRYLTGRHSILSEANLTDEFVNEMKAQALAVCPADKGTDVARPGADPSVKTVSRPAPDVEDDEESAPSKPARPKAPAQIVRPAPQAVAPKAPVVEAPKPAPAPPAATGARKIPTITGI